MSIFSSWLAAPNSLVITYTGRSTRSTISESLWPIPAVSTRIRSKPLARRNASASSSTALVERLLRRVAIERMKIRSSRRLFMRIRSPSSAPPVRRRVGSTASTAIRVPGSHCTKRLSSSSVTVLLPAPPVPVIPTTGARWAVARQEARSWARSSSEVVPSSSADRARAIVRSLDGVSRPCAGSACSASSARRAFVRVIRSSIIPVRPSAIPSLGW